MIWSSLLSEAVAVQEVEGRVHVLVRPGGLDGLPSGPQLLPRQPTLFSQLILTSKYHRLVCRVTPQLTARPLDLEIIKLKLSTSNSLSDNSHPRVLLRLPDLLSKAGRSPDLLMMARRRRRLVVVLVVRVSVGLECSHHWRQHIPLLLLLLLRPGVGRPVVACPLLSTLSFSFHLSI